MLRGGVIMATFSILENVKIDDSGVAEALLSAIEQSANTKPRERNTQIDYRMANSEDTVRLHEMRHRRRSSTR